MGGEDVFCSIVSADTGYYLFGCSTSKDYDCTDTGWHTGVNTYNDYYILRLDDTGKIIWNKSFGGSGGDRAGRSGNSAVWDERDKTIVVTGTSSSADYMVTGNHGGSDIWTIKVDANGNLIWKKIFGGIHDDEGSGISLVPGIGYVNTGSIRGGIGETDEWVGVLDMAGNVVSDTIFGGIKSEGAAFAFPYKQGYITVGTTASSSGFTEGINTGTLGWEARGNVSYLAYGVNAVKEVTDVGKKLYAYPNPSIEFVKIDFPTRAMSSIMVTNIQGQKVYESIMKGNIGTVGIKTDAWVKGIYIVKWQSDGGETLTTKFNKD